MGSTFTFGNCEDCGQYAKLNPLHRCRECVEEEWSQINTALELIQMKSDITLEEISHALHVEEGRVLGWVRKGVVRCIVVEYDCPRCHTHIQNRLNCPNCGYDPLHGNDPESRITSALSSRMVTLDRRKSGRQSAYAGRAKVSTSSAKSVTE